jgi:hypothetical protein
MIDEPWFTTMRWFLSLLVFAISGLVVAQGAPPVEDESQEQLFYVVAVQAPPLIGFPARHIPSDSMEDAIFIDEEPIIRGQRRAIVEGHLMYTSAKPKGEVGDESRRELIELIERGGIWSPSLVVAEEATTYLSGTLGLRSEMNAELQPIGSDTLFGEGRLFFLFANEYAATNEWWRKKATNIDYSSIDDLESTTVLELTLSTNEYFGGSFMVQVLMHVVDPVTGDVVARARKRKSVKIADPKLLFSDGAARLKEQYREIARELVRKNISKVGITSD